MALWILISLCNCFLWLMFCVKHIELPCFVLNYVLSWHQSALFLHPIVMIRTVVPRPARRRKDIFHHQNLNHTLHAMERVEVLTWQFAGCFGSSWTESSRQPSCTWPWTWVPLCGWWSALPGWILWSSWPRLSDTLQMCTIVNRRR